MLTDSLKIKLKKNLILLKHPDIKYFSSFNTNEIFESSTTIDYHLEKAVKFLKNCAIYNYKKELTGFSAGYDLIRSEFKPYYVETTGYTLGTLINLNKNTNIKFSNKDNILSIAKSILKYQLDSGSFTGGHSQMKNFKQPSLFNSAQVALGLVEVKKQFEANFLDESLVKLNFFFNKVIDDNGSIDKQYFYKQNFSSYYTRAIYGILKLADFLNDEKLKKKCLNIMDIISKRVNRDGSIRKWGFLNNENLHTIIYTIRGFLECGLILKKTKFIEIAVGAIKFLETRGKKISFGKQLKVLSSNPRKNDYEICFTGLAQLGIVAKKIEKLGYKIDTNLMYCNSLKILKTHQLSNCYNQNLEGGLLGSKPFYGQYQPNMLPQWAIKFFIDLLLIEKSINPMSINS